MPSRSGVRRPKHILGRHSRAPFAPVGHCRIAALTIWILGNSFGHHGRRNPFFAIHWSNHLPRSIHYHGKPFPCREPARPSLRARHFVRPRSFIGGGRRSGKFFGIPHRNRIQWRRIALPFGGPDRLAAISAVRVGSGHSQGHPRRRRKTIESDNSETCPAILGLPWRWARSTPTSTSRSRPAAIAAPACTPLPEDVEGTLRDHRADHFLFWTYCIRQAKSAGEAERW